MGGGPARQKSQQRTTSWLCLSALFRMVSLILLLPALLRIGPDSGTLDSSGSTVAPPLMAMIGDDPLAPHNLHTAFPYDGFPYDGFLPVDIVNPGMSPTMATVCWISVNTEIKHRRR